MRPFWAGCVACGRALGLGARQCGVGFGRATFRPGPGRCREASGAGPGQHRLRGFHQLRAPAARVEPTGQNGLQHRADLDPFAECRALDALAGVLSAGPERLALGGRPDLGLGSGPVAEPPQLGDDGVEPLALDELHGVEADIPVLAHLVDRHDVGVVQPGRGAGLAAEPLLDHPVAGHLPRQDLQRHAAAQRDLLGLVHDAHAAPADLAEDPVVADLAQGRIRGPGIPGHFSCSPCRTPSACSTLTIAGKSSRISSASSG